MRKIDLATSLYAGCCVIALASASNGAAITDSFFYIENKRNADGSTREQMYLGIAGDPSELSGTVSASWSTASFSAGGTLPEYSSRYLDGKPKAEFGILIPGSETLARQDLRFSLTDQNGTDTAFESAIVSTSQPLRYPPLVQNVRIGSGTAPNVTWTNPGSASELASLGVDFIRARVVDNRPDLFDVPYAAVTADLSLNSFQFRDISGFSNPTVRIELVDAEGDLIPLPGGGVSRVENLSSGSKVLSGFVELDEFQFFDKRRSNFETELEKTVGNAPERRMQKADTASLSGVNLFDGFDFEADRPTVVLTHGWQPNLLGQLAYSSLSDTDFQNAMYSEIGDRYGEDVNILRYAWKGAYTKPFVTVTSIKDPVPYIYPSGIDLGKLLYEKLGSDYDQPLHLIGHSYGAAVSSVAVTELAALGMETTHLTALDAPINRFFGTLPPTFFDSVAGSPQLEYFENYFSLNGPKTDLPGAFGAPVETAHINYLYKNANHSQVWQRYSNSVDGILDCSPSGGFINSVALRKGCLPVSYDGLGFERAKYNAVEASLDPILFENATYDQVTNTVTIKTGSDGYGVFFLDVPDRTETLFFDLVFDLIGDEDWLEVSYDDDLLGFFRGADFASSRALQFDFSDYSGSTGVLSLLLAGEGPVPAQITASNFQYLVAEPSDVSPVPLPASVWLLLAGLGALRVIRVRRTRHGA